MPVKAEGRGEWNSMTDRKDDDQIQGQDRAGVSSGRSPPWEQPMTNPSQVRRTIWKYQHGSVYHFPTLSTGTASLRGSCIEANPKAKRETRPSF
jgi:hypothetical protein